MAIREQRESPFAQTDKGLSASGAALIVLSAALIGTALALFLLGPDQIPDASHTVGLKTAAETAAPDAPVTSQAPPAPAAHAGPVDTVSGELAPAAPEAAPPPQPIAAPASGEKTVIAADGTLISDPALTQTSSEGPLPMIALDGRRPMDVYAGRFDRTDSRPRVAVVVGGLGLGEAATQAAIDKLPPAVTLAFTPYGAGLQNWLAAARANGHEVLLEIPMEPFDYPDNDPGPNTLMTGGAAGENMARLRWVLGRMTGYVGLVNVQGTKFLGSRTELEPFMAQVKTRGLIFLEAPGAERSEAAAIAKALDARYTRAARMIDRTPTRESIDRELQALTAEAREKRVAIGIASASPAAIDRIATWAKLLEEQGIAIAPVSATADLAISTVSP